MTDQEKRTSQAIEFANTAINVADKFIKKVETGRARSKETYADLIGLKAEAENLKYNLS